MELNNNIINSLDEDQKAAVLAPLQNVLCIASAGSGKTHTLTNRIAYWISKGEDESSFMLLTFTNKAAAEMTERIKNTLKKETVSLMSGTFHHMGVVFLRKYSSVIGIDKGFKILTVSDAEAIIKTCRDEFLKGTAFDLKSFPKKNKIYSVYSSAINLNSSVYDICMEYDMLDDVAIAVEDIIELYKKRKRENNYLDFDDLLVYFLELLKKDSIRSLINSQYKNIFVDEYQDINHIQNEIIELLNGNNRLTVVGDDCQCIYSFRGSRIDYILDFESSHDNTLVFELKNNYRSSEDIVLLASNSIEKNDNSIEKHMRAYNSSIKVPTFTLCEREDIQSSVIVRRIKRYMMENPGAKYSDVAILLRTNMLTKAIEIKLRESKIPCKVQCGIGFFERAHIKDIIAFLKLSNNPNDEVSFWRVFGLVPGLGDSGVKKLFVSWRALNFDFMAVSSIKVNNRAEQFKLVAELLRRANETCRLDDKVSLFYNEFYRDSLVATYGTEDIDERMLDVEILINILKEYLTVDDFFDEISLDNDLYSAGDSISHDKVENKVVISTVHKSKGLEWKKVFLPYLNTSIFPHCEETQADIEEERRLFYVAITRAKEELDILATMSTIRFNNLSTSRFVNEIDDIFCEKSIFRF